jgi:acyl carrier protein
MLECDVVAQLDAYVRDHFSVSAGDGRFGPAVDLFEEGYVDSVGLAELLQFIEDSYGVVIPDEELLSEDFASLEGIARIVCARAGART